MYIITLNGLASVGKSYSFGKFFNLGIADLCKPAVYSARIELPPDYMKLSAIIGIWVRSSVIPVLTLFCALVLIASLLTEELDERTKKEAFATDGDALDDWLDQFDKLHIFVENIKNFFTPILAITVIYFFVQFPYQVFDIIRDIWILKPAGQRIPQLLTIVLMFSVRLVFIVAVCQQLQDKVYREIII